MLALFGVSTASAQTAYTQSAPQGCQLDTFNCNQIPLGSAGSYNFLFGNMTFTLGVSGDPACCVLGHITQVIQSPKLACVYSVPPGGVCWTGPFSVNWEVTGSNGTVYTGTVNGTAKVIKACGGRGTCWPYAIVESSTVTVTPNN
jgi:hypothetical protein